MRKARCFSASRLFAVLITMVGLTLFSLVTASVAAFFIGEDEKALRRQMHQPFRKPLIVMTPKSLLRHELSVSALEDLSRGAFARVIGEIDELPPAEIRRVVFCSGKVYFDLLRARRKEGLREVALVRTDILEPLLPDLVRNELRRYMFVLKQLGVDPHDEHLFVVGTVEDTDSSSFRQSNCGAPQEVVPQFLVGRLFKGKHLTALRIHPRHDVLN